MTGEWKRNIKRGNQLHGTLTVVCLGAALVLAACSDDGDDLVFEDASVDSGRPDAARDSGRDSSVADVSSDRSTVDQGAPEAARPDASEAGPRDAGAEADARTVDAPLDVARDVARDVVVADARDAATVDVRSDVTTDAGIGPAPEAAAPEASIDARPEAEAAAPVPLQMCTALDAIYGIGTDAAACATVSNDNCPARAENWVNDIVFNYAIGEINADCRINGILPTTAAGGVEYGTDLSTWTLKFFGCANPDDAPPAFGLVPVAQAGHIFTTADLQLLSDYYVTAIKDALAAPAQGDPTTLTVTQESQIRAELARGAAAVPGTQNSGAYTYSNCPADAGADGRTD